MKPYIGAAYYPELWDEEEIGKDIERCRRLGINTLRIGEFAWGKMEPREGDFQLDWLERVVDRLHESGIAVVLCTPTCTPPRWMMRQYPEIVRVLSSGERMPVFSRCHPCKSSPLMREKNRLIVTELAKRFGSHPGVIGWQIDNELYAYDGGCYCDFCRRGFQQSLKQQYQTVDCLNQSWGMYRWSLDYGSFEEIDPPPPLGSAPWKHPSLQEAWLRYQCELIATYVEEQAEILHRYSKVPVGTDMMQSNKLSYSRVTEKLDVVQYNHYGTAEMLAIEDSFYDFLRPLKKQPFWVTETQVGWNGSEFADFGYRPVGNCYVNTWLPIALGGEMNLYWLYRAHPNGHELAHGALLSTAGRPYRVSEEVTRASEEMQKCSAFLQNTRIRSEIAIHYSSLAERIYQFSPMLKGFNYRVKLVERFHGAFKHYNVDLIETDHPLDGYHVLFSPFLAHIDSETEQRIKEWVAAGGTWIVGPMSDIMTSCGSKYTQAPFSFLEEYAGIYTRYQKPVSNDAFKALWKSGEEETVSDYYDAFEPTEGIPLITYRGDEFDGYAAVTERRVGQGRVIVLGSVISFDGLRRLTGLSPIAKASDNVRLVERSGVENGLIAVEQKHQEGYLILEGKYLDLVHDRTVSGKLTLAPYEVLVLKKL